MRVAVVDCRGGGIRTHGLFVPNEARYRAALHPEMEYKDTIFQKLHKHLLSCIDMTKCGLFNVLLHCKFDSAGLMPTYVC